MLMSLSCRALKSQLSLLDRPQRRCRLVAALVELILGRAIGDNARRRLRVGHAVLHHHRPQRDTQIQVAIEPDMADGASVVTALLALQLSNDLHGADLRRT